MPQILNAMIYRAGANADLVFARSKPTWINLACLAAGVEKTVTVPTGANFCIFSGDADFYVRPDATAALPAGDVTDGTGSELNPAQWDVHDVQALHLIAADDANVTMASYR